MKIHSIRTVNLASLEGENVVDIEKGLRSPALYLITGPTGSGKSTLLDGAMLALFGSTPRLTNAHGKTREKPWNIVTRGAREARAEVEFTVTPAGGVAERYRATWGCKAWRPDLKSEPKPVLRLEKLGTGGWATLAESGDKAWREVHERVLRGMRAEDFTRTVLLPQGQFGHFLHADERERAEMLARITGTRRYRRLGEAAARARSAAAGAVEQIRQRMGEVRPLEPDARAALEDEREAARAGATELDAAARVLHARVVWLETFLKAVSDERNAAMAAAAAERVWQAVAGDVARLEEQRRAEPALRAVEQADRAERAHQVAARESAEDTAKERSAAERLPGLDQAVRRATETREEAHREKARAQPEIADARTAIHDAGVRARQHEDALRLAKEAAEKASRTIRERDESKRAAEAQSSRVEECGRAVESGWPSELASQVMAAFRGDERPTLERLRDASGADEDALSQHAHALDDLRSSTDALAEIEARGGHLQSRVASLDAEISQAESVAAASEARAAFAAAEVERLQTLLHAIEEHLDTLKRQATLPELLRRLQDGEPCDLCGSRHHPFRSDPTLAPVEAELEAKRKRVSKERDGIGRDLKRAEQTVAESNASAAGARAQAELLRRQRDEKHEELVAEKRRRGDVLARVAALEESYFRTRGGRPTDPGARLPVVEQALMRVRELARALDAWPEARAHAASKEALVKDADDNWRAQVELANAAAARRQEAEGRRERLLRDGEPEERAKRLDQALASAEEELRKAESARAGGHSTAEVARVQANASHEKLVEAERGREEAIVALREALAATGFDSAEDVRRASLTAPEVREMEGRIEAARRERDVTAGAFERTRATLATVRGSRPDGLDDAADVGAERAHLEGAREESSRAHARLGAIEEKLRADSEAAARLATIESELRVAEHRSDLAEELSGLIGTQNGAAFETFVQTLNLERLIGAANERLARLHGRFRLVQSRRRDTDAAEVGFSVRDAWLGDAERPLTTLSGGETFLLSLSLALGLGDMRRIAMPIETLLLDEGFGTLDRETLDAAMGALSSLANEGACQIGIISHVEALRDSIPAQIRVEKLGSGRSRVAVSV